MVQTPLVHRAATAPTLNARADALRERELVLAAVAALDNERVGAVLNKAYVDPAGKQYAAAADLGMSFATYRRDLARGVEKVTEALWGAEVLPV